MINKKDLPMPYEETSKLQKIIDKSQRYTTAFELTEEILQEISEKQELLESQRSVKIDLHEKFIDACDRYLEDAPKDVEK